METEIFKNMVFDIGWKKEDTIEMFSRKFNIELKLKAYFEKDGITKEQIESYNLYINDKSGFLRPLEKTLIKMSGSEKKVLNRYIPQMILFERNGEFAMLLDDKEDMENGIAAVLYPDINILPLESYL